MYMYLCAILCTMSLFSADIQELTSHLPDVTPHYNNGIPTLKELCLKSTATYFARHLKLTTLTDYIQPSQDPFAHKFPRELLVQCMDYLTQSIMYPVMHISATESIIDPEFKNRKYIHIRPDGNIVGIMNNNGIYVGTIKAYQPNKATILLPLVQYGINSIDTCKRYVSALSAYHIAINHGKDDREIQIYNLNKPLVKPVMIDATHFLGACESVVQWGILEKSFETYACAITNNDTFAIKNIYNTDDDAWIVRRLHEAPVKLSYPKTKKSLSLEKLIFYEGKGAVFVSLERRHTDHNFISIGYAPPLIKRIVATPEKTLYLSQEGDMDNITVSHPYLKQNGTVDFSISSIIPNNAKYAFACMPDHGLRAIYTTAHGSNWRIQRISPNYTTSTTFEAGLHEPCNIFPRKHITDQSGKYALVWLANNDLLLLSSPTSLTESYALLAIMHSMQKKETNPVERQAVNALRKILSDPLQSESSILGFSSMEQLCKPLGIEHLAKNPISLAFLRAMTNKCTVEQHSIALDSGTICTQRHYSCNHC